MNASEEVKNVLGEVLKLGNRARQFDANTALFGAIAEFDSMAAVAVIATLEDKFGFAFEDDEITAEVFETVGSLTQFVEGKLTI